MTNQDIKTALAYIARALRIELFSATLDQGIAEAHAECDWAKVSACRVDSLNSLLAYVNEVSGRIER